MSRLLERIGPFQYQRYTASLPALLAGAETACHDVLIVGGGPVGLCVALGLAHHGVRSVVIEADDSVCEGSRAACISRRSLEIVERLGVAGAFTAKGLAWTTGRSYYREQEVLVFSMPHDASQKYPPMINLEQYYIEQYLVDEVHRCNAAQPGMIDIRWASKVTALAQEAEAVQLTVENALGRYTCQAGWVVACDGGQSFVRNALGLELRGATYQGRYAIVDIELASTSPTERRAWFDPPWAPGTTILMHRQPDNIWRIDYQLRQAEDPDVMLQPERVQAFVQRHLDAIGEGHLPWTPVWSSIYRAGAMTLDAYRHGRILFAGNAAHAMPIFGVRGLNSGFDDADNLIWKLAGVVRKQVPEQLLDTYSSERVQAFHVNAESAMRSTEFMSPPTRGFDLLREACLSLAGAHPDIARLINPRQTQAITYSHSPLSSDSDVFEHGPGPGATLTDVQLDEQGPHLTDCLPRARFTAFVFDDDGGAAIRLAAALRKDGLPGPGVKVVRVAEAKGDGTLVVTLADPKRRLREAYAARDGTVYLVRPDGHVAGRWHRPGTQRVVDALRKACSAASDAKEFAGVTS